MTFWTVLAPGRSLRRVSAPQLKAEGPIIAVNNAALSGLPFDFWCALDVPRKFEQIWLKLPADQRREHAPLWCRPSTAVGWRELGFRCWTFAELEEDFRRENLPLARHERKTSMLNLTILATITRCIGLGATRIQCWGVDMEGSSHSHGRDPETGRSPAVWRERWSHETRVWDLANSEWRSAGTEVVRMMPE